MVIGCSLMSTRLTIEMVHSSNILSLLLKVYDNNYNVLIPIYFHVFRSRGHFNRFEHQLVISVKLKSVKSSNESLRTITSFSFLIHFDNFMPFMVTFHDKIINHDGVLVYNFMKLLLH